MARRITCKTCGRENMSEATGGECGRCYGRRKAGKDPITNEPIIAVAVATETACKDTVELLSIQKTTSAPNINEQSTENYVPESAPPPKKTDFEPKSSVHSAVMTYMDAPKKQGRSRKPRPYPTPETITLQFTTARDAELFARLQMQAQAHRRTLDAEILFQLEDQSMHIESLYL